MVVHDFHLLRVAAAPDETNPPLIIDADAVLAGPVAFQSLQPVARRCKQIAERPSPVQVYLNEWTTRHNLPAVSAEMAIKLGRLFNVSPELWMGIQADYDLEIARDRSQADIFRRVHPLKLASAA